MIVRLHHAQITIPPGVEAEARQFYCELLGLNEVTKPTSLQNRGVLWLQLSTQALHIGVEGGVDRHATKAHLAYEVSDLNYWRKRLTDAGYEIETGVPIPGFDRFELRDFFGNRIEMIQPIWS